MIRRSITLHFLAMNVNENELDARRFALGLYYSELVYMDAVDVVL